MYITGQHIAIAVASMSLFGGILAIILKIHKFVLHQEKQDREIEKLKRHHEEDMKKLENSEVEEFGEISEALQLLTKSVLACLKGLKEQGVDGPVIEAIDEIQAYLGAKAYK